MKGAIFFILIWIILCSLCPLFSQAEKKGLELIKSGEALFEKTEYEQAMAKYEEARDFIYTDTNKLRLYKNMSLVYYSLGKEKESVAYIMKALEIEPNARLRGKIPPGFRIMFLNHQKRLKKLIDDVKSLTDRKLFAEARKRLEQSVEFKNHKNNKRVQELKNYIKEAEIKEKKENNPHFSQEIVTRCQRCPWMQGARPKPTQAYCMYVEESEGVQRSRHG